MSLTTSAHWMYNPGGGFYDREIDGSLRFVDFGDNNGSNHYLSRTPSSSGSSTTWTWSAWVKRGANLGTPQHLFSQWEYPPNNQHRMFFGSDDRLTFMLYNGSSNSHLGCKTPIAQLRDISSWYHIVFVWDTTNGTADDRMRVYINGERQTTFASTGGAGQSGSINPSSSLAGYINNTGLHTIGTFRDPSLYSAFENFDGYMADVNFVDGTALDASSFGETKSGIWIPKAYSGSYGTNGFHLEFAGNTNDTSGNGNNFTSFNISSHDYMLDSPTNNFPTNRKGYNQIASQGNLRFERSSNANNHTGNFPNVFAKSGKWYAELRMIDSGIDTAAFAVVEGRSYNEPSDNTAYQYTVDNTTVADGKGYYSWIINAKKTDGFAQTETSYGTALTANVAAIIMCALDLDNGKVWWGKDGTWFNSGDPAAGTNAAFTSSNLTDSTDGFGFASSLYMGRGGAEHIFNYGQDSTFTGNTTAGGNADANGYGDFKYAPPSGFLAMCSANLPAPTFDPADDATPEDHFNTVLYTGNGGATNAITGVGFQPDFVWLKVRNQVDNHVITDGLRGTSNPTGGRYYLIANSTGGENTSSFSTDRIKAFGSDGFTVGTSDKMVNGSGDTYAAWCWKGANSAGVTNTNGSITSTVSANTDAGFSIVTFTGDGTNATIGHGLGVTPQMIIIKNRTGTSGYQNWGFYHEDLGNVYNLYLNTDNSVATENAWNTTSPTSSVFTLGAGVFNPSGQNMVAYCFAEKDGYSKIGKYTGNGSSDGSFIYTGFRPSLLLMKRTDSSGDWMLEDNRRLGYNVDNNDLVPNRTYSEATDDRLDILSNGFKFRSSFATTNASGGSYIYLAIAEQPFKYANAR